MKPHRRRGVGEMPRPTLDPLQALVLRLLRTQPSTTEELRARLVEQGESLRPTRLSAVLHDLRASGRLELCRNCNVMRPRLPVRQEWHTV